MAPARTLLPRWIGARQRADEGGGRKRRPPRTGGLTGVRREPTLPPLPATEVELAAAEDPGLPAIITRAQEQAKCRQALARLGYRKVRAEYARHRQQGRDTFNAISHAEVWPTMDFVRGWLKDERRRILLHARSTFIAVMLTTIVTGVAFVIVLVLLNWRT